MRTDAAKNVNMRITGLGQCRDLIRKSNMFIECKAQIASGACNSEKVGKVAA